MRRLPFFMGAGALLLCAGVQAAAQSEFSAAMNSAMDRMMAGMKAPPSGDVDRDFVRLMIPHHQAAIDMAVAELRYGRDAHLKRIAQEIIVDQQQEIAAMDLAVGNPLPPGAAAPAQQLPHEHSHGALR
jgi:uncharacterized protein (DUF305 family)